jgi:dTDP-4-dehydrorhamnose 3,5-epimerase
MVNLGEKEEVKSIEGAIFTPLNIIQVSDGNIQHGMKKEDSGYNGFGEAYFSNINFNSIKGWKRHFSMILNIIVPVGKIRFVLFDDREKSLTFNNFQELIISEENYGRLTVPPMIWFGFQGLSEGRNIILNISNIIHDPEEQENIMLEDIKYNWNKRG